MEKIKLRSLIGADGILQIQTPTALKDTLVEVVVIVQPLPDNEVVPIEDVQPRYNAWGKKVTKESIGSAVTRMQQLRREVALDKISLRSMIDEGRRF